MKKLIPLLLITVYFSNCTEKNKAIEFAELHPNEFNAGSFEIPTGNLPDSFKHAHDSCMGFSFDANMMLVRNSNFFIGHVVNKKTLKVVKTLDELGLTRPGLISRFNIITNPCYERTILNFPLKTLLGENFSLQIPGVDEALNKEINDAITASDNAEMQAGSWIYLDLKNLLKNLMDTAKSAEALRYKTDLLDTSNMILTAVESITDVSFLINTKKNISQPLQALLKTKPSLPNDKSSIQLFYIDAYTFKIALNGFFPVAGEFMKAELK